jgi:hypothetical protein
VSSSRRLLVAPACSCGAVLAQQCRRRQALELFFGRNRRPRLLQHSTGNWTASLESAPPAAPRWHGGRPSTCRKRIDRKGWTLVQAYRDAAVSGATTLRLGYQAMLQASREADFHVLAGVARSTVPRPGRCRRALQTALNNELYVGRLVKNPETGRRRSRQQNRMGVVSTGTPARRIIDQSLWDQVTQRQAALDRRGAAVPGGAAVFWWKGPPATCSRA